MYKLASGRLRNKTALTTLQTQNGTYTTDINSTIKQMIVHFTPEDNGCSDSEHHKRIRQQITEAPDISNNEEFTQEEILAALAKFNPQKAPGEDGLTSEILLKTFKCFPSFLTEIYNTCLREGCFPKQWKRSSIFPMVKPGKEKSTEVSKYRPISLLNTETPRKTSN